MGLMLVTLEALLIVTALSMDAFVSSFAYGANKIKMPFLSIAVINLVCCSILALSLLFGNIVRSFLPGNVTIAICFAILFCLGLSKIFDSAVKAFIRKRSKFRKKIQFSAFNLAFILNIYANPEDADTDSSRVLSPFEAVYLAVALSLDGLAVGFGAGIANTSPLLLITFSLVTNMLAVMLGHHLGNKVAQKLSLDFNWISGVMLIFLAVMKLF